MGPSQTQPVAVTRPQNQTFHSIASVPKEEGLTRPSTWSAGVAALAIIIAIALPAAATDGGVYEQGTSFVASTYPFHGRPNEIAPQAWGPSIDINVQFDDGSGLDCDRPVFAPESGTVRQVTSDFGGGWGNAIVWTNEAGTEQLFMAHLSSVLKAGPVLAGDTIALAGATGLSIGFDDFCHGAGGAHLHLNRTVMSNGAWTAAPVVLNDLVVQAGGAYQSTGTPAAIVSDNEATRRKDLRWNITALANATLSCVLAPCPA